MLPTAFSIRLTRQAVLSFGLLLCLLVSGWQQLKYPPTHHSGVRISWIADEPAAEELLSLADDEATTERTSSSYRYRRALAKSKAAFGWEATAAVICAEKSFAATLAAYAQQYAHHILPPGYVLFLFRYSLF